MFFVFSSWYIVLAILLVAVIVMAVVFFKMDKTDRTLIQEFVAQNAQNSDKENEPSEIKQEIKSNKKK